MRPPSNEGDPEESGDDDPDDSHTEDISEHFEHVINAPNVTARGRFNILPCPQDETMSANAGPPLQVKVHLIFEFCSQAEIPTFCLI